MRKKLAIDHISIAQATRWAGVSESTYRSWAQDRLVRPLAADGCDLGDIFEMAAVRSLLTWLSPEDVRYAWRQVRDHVRELQDIADGLGLVWDDELQEAHLVYSPEAVGRLVFHGRRFRAIPLAESLRRVQDAYRRAVEHRWDRHRPRETAGSANSRT